MDLDYLLNDGLDTFKNLEFFIYDGNYFEDIFTGNVEDFLI